MYVNSADDSIYIGSSTDAPIKLVTELNIESYVKEYAGSGSELNHELPDKSSLVVGNAVMFADKEWVISHRTSTEMYLTLKSLSGISIQWNDLQEKCTNFENSFSEEQKNCLKSVTAGNTSGKVFVATKEQMEGGFSYFINPARRNLAQDYWTSSERDSGHVWSVNSGGYLDVGPESESYGFRPSVCIDLTLYNT